MLIVQSVQCHVVAICTGCTVVQMAVVGYMVLMWIEVADMAGIRGPIRE
jgi:hypothetical protein